MRRAAARAAGALLWLAAAGGVAAPALALTVERVARSLREMPSTFTRVASAPRSEFRKVDAAGALASGATPSQLGRAAAPSTVFRVAEVPPARVAVTRELLDTLQARQTEQQAIVIDLPADVLFDFDKAELREDARASLDKAAELLRSYPDAPVTINGHTDGKGSDAYNDALSRRRAQAVAARLQGDSARPFMVEGFGKQRPLVPNTRPDGSDDPQGRQRNRRVEIIIQPMAAPTKKS
jgi:outer membrane protein OmpA-like peptidoglycan-associated protein